MKMQVIGGIVTYNPEITLLNECVKAIASICEKILIVDNNSNNKKEIRLLASEKVLDGQTLSSVPEVETIENVSYLKGWSIDGENLIDLSTYKISGDLELKAVIGYVLLKTGFWINKMV